MKKKSARYIGFKDKSLTCSDLWLTQNLGTIEKEFGRLDLHALDAVDIDLSSISQCDVNGAILIQVFIERMQEQNISVKLHNISSEIRHLLDITLLSDDISAEKTRHRENFFSEIGHASYHAYSSVKEYLTFIGELAFTLLYALRYPSSFRMKELLRGIQEHSIKALPIVLLTSMLIGLVVAYQSALQIKKYGADIFIVDMLIISVTRELAPLITAIVVAGRSGSAYTAEIGVMKITEEIDAMRTMGFDPYRFIILPNILALMIALPMIIFLADIMGIIGGMLAARMELSITPIEFINRIEEIFNIDHLYVGLIKGPFFALIIASIGCMRGMAVENSTDSIGINTKASVVSAIFMVIICDAIFSIIFLELGI
jgi:phospholipid/cholesterol/gamma-HCH transport system permease protein